MPTQLASLVVANLETTERYFHLFEVECWNSARTLIQLGPLTVGGEWDGTSKWKQKDPLFFRGLTLGTTYSFRVRILTKDGGPASAWSAWVDETAGDTTAPNPSYSATARKSGGAVLVDSAPASPPSDLDHYEFHFNLTNTSPGSSTAPNLPNSPDGKTVIATDPDDTIYLWIRAVDTSGNRQTWTSLGSLNVGTLENANDGTTRFARTGSHSSYRPTTNPLTATDAGATATVSIAAFVNRLYENAGHTDISYNSGSITSLSFATTYFIDMSDSALAGGTVTFNARTTRAAVRGFFVGSITTPADGAADTVGYNDGGAGAQLMSAPNIYPLEHVVTTSGTGSPGSQSVTNPKNARDANLTSAAVLDAQGTVSTSGTRTATLELKYFQLPPLGRESVTLKVRSEVVTFTEGANGSGSASVEYSTDGGASWTTIYNETTTTRSLQTDSVSLPPNLAAGLLMVRASVQASGTTSWTAFVTMNLHEVWVEVN